MNTQHTSTTMDEFIHGTVKKFIEHKMEKIIEEEILITQEKIKKRIEDEAFKTSIELARMFKVDRGEDHITISIIRK